MAAAAAGAPPTERPCGLIVHQERSEAANVAELKKMLEDPDHEKKIEAMRQVVLLMMGGEPMQTMLMTVIRFAVPVDNKDLQKLLLFYWECVDKTDSEGKMLHEMILVCNALRNNLIHPNEFLRGAALRFLCKVKEAELVEPLVPAVKANLDYKHAYVRRYAVNALHHIYQNFDFLCPDAPELVHELLVREGDAAVRRNAFIMLAHTAQDRAVAYLAEALPQVANMGETLQLTVVELVRRVCRSNPGERSRYIKAIFTLLEASSPAVRFEAATTLVAMSAAPTAVRAASSTFIEILVKEADNTVKLIVLDRLKAIKQHYPKLLQEQVMDMLRALGAPSLAIRQRVLDIALDLVSPKNIEEVVLALKKEVQRSHAASAGDDTAEEYRAMLIQAIHGCAVKFPSVASNVIHVLLDFLGDSGAAGVEVVLFVREVVHTYPELREQVVAKLVSCLPLIESSKVARTLLWVVGEYSESAAQIDVAFTALRKLVGDLPLVRGDDDDDDDDDDDADGGAGAGAASAASAAAAAAAADGPGKTARASAGPRVLADGTYATQSAVSQPDGSGGKKKSKGGSDDSMPNLRRLLFAGDYFLAAAIGVTLTKLALKVGRLPVEEVPVATRNLLTAEVLYVITNMLRLGEPSNPRTVHKMDPDSAERLYFCIRVLTLTPEQLAALQPLDFGVLLVDDSRAALERQLADEADKAEAAVAAAAAAAAAAQPGTAAAVVANSAAASAAKGGKASGRLQLGGAATAGVRKPGSGGAAGAGDGGDVEVTAQCDELIRINQLRTQKVYGLEDIEDFDAGADLSRATGTSQTSGQPAYGVFGDSLSRVYQLTGFSDPVYAEANVTVNQYDILLDVVVMNQTPETLQGVTLELSTIGDLKLVDRPQQTTIAPGGRASVRAAIKVSSTEKGAIFGNIVYDIAGTGGAGGDSNVVVLNDVHLDIMDYIAPAWCTELQFRAMWAAFEWENKVAVNTPLTGVAEYLALAQEATKMACLSPSAADDAECGFLSANLYARSAFGEDALANISIEEQTDGTVSGFVRIRAKTQGIALALGDRVNARQRSAVPTADKSQTPAAAAAAAAEGTASA